jgi:hypothetical protein
MPAPTNYNDAGTVFRIDPTAMFRYATVDLKAEAEAIAGSIENMFHIWQGLKLGWSGTSADEAQDFGNSIAANLGRLFGTSADPESGLLPRVARAVSTAAINFGVAEHSNVRMFDSLTSGLNGPGSPNTPPSRDSHGGQVIETTPPQP